MLSFPLSFLPISSTELEELIADQFKVVLRNLDFKTDHLTNKEAETLLRHLDTDLAKELDSLIEKARSYHNMFGEAVSDIEKQDADKEVYEAGKKLQKAIELYREKHNIKYS